MLPAGIPPRAIRLKQFLSHAVEPLIVFRVFLRFTGHFLFDFPNFQQGFGFAQFDFFHNSITSDGGDAEVRLFAEVLPSR